MAEGYVPRWTAKLDPKQDPSRTSLVKHDLDTREPERIFQGRVVDERGEPIAGARIEPRFIRKGSSGTTALNGTDPLAVTNAKGEFRLGVAEADVELLVQVSATDKASRLFNRLRSGETKHTLTLEDGVSVRVRILKDGQPLAGVGVGVVQTDRGIEQFLGHHELATNASGTVTFLHVPAGEKLFVYGIMKTLREHGSIAVKEIRTGTSGSTLDLGDLAVVPGFRLQGRLVLSDGKPLPANTKVMLSRDNAWDLDFAAVDEEGRFRFDSVPSELVDLNVRVPGYYPSPDNKHYDPLRKRPLFGVITSNVDDCTLIYLPGAPPNNSNDQKSLDTHQRLKTTSLNGEQIEEPVAIPQTRAEMGLGNLKQFARTLTWRDFMAVGLLMLLCGWLVRRTKISPDRDSGN